MIKNKTLKKTFRAIDLSHYGSYGIKGSYGSDKTKMVTVRMDKVLEDRIKRFIGDPNSRKVSSYSWCSWNKGELIRAAVTLFLDTFDAQCPRKRGGAPPKDQD